MLRVTTDPGVPSLIEVDGIPMDTWGLNWVKLPPGTYTVSFEDVLALWYAGAPGGEVVAGETTTVTGVFEPYGFLKVNTAGGGPGTIYVDGDAS